jgi:hypothetical protein
VRRLAPAALLLFLALALASTAYAGMSEDAARARESLQVLNRSFASRTGLYSERESDVHVAYAWSFSQAVAAAIAVASLPDATRGERRAAALRVRQLASYRTGGVYGSSRGGAVFVDDNLWIAQDLLDWFRISSDRKALTAARGIFRFAVSEWDATPSDPCAGGVYWTQEPPNRDRAAVTTGGAALLGMRLALLRHADPSLEDWSQRMLGWLDGCLREPTGLYANDIGPTGFVNPRPWSYNQGLVIGALVLAARKGDRAALVRAEQLGTTSLWYLSPAALNVEPPEFVAVLARNLLLLGRADHDPRWRDAVEAYGDLAWTTARDPATGLFRFGAPTTRLIAQAAMTQIYALLGATPDSTPSPPAG